ncbi:MAG TPA: hypothetical protein VIV15_10750, partial [Anaerolineales bacterium]
MKHQLRVGFRLIILFSLLLGMGMVPRDQGALAQVTFDAQMNKQFTPNQIPAGGTSRLRIIIFNPNSFPLTNASWTDNLVGVQPGIFLDTPVSPITTCGGSVTAAPGGTTVSLAGGTVPQQTGGTPGSCYVEVSVSSITPGNLI